MSAWFKRVHWPEAGEAALGFGYEWWDLDPTHYEGHQELRARLQKLHRKTMKRELAYRLADNLLTDLLVVVGGVETTFRRFVTLLDEVQAWSDEHVRPQMEPGVPQGLGHPKVTEAWYEFANLLYWTRGVEERLSRKPFGRHYRGLRDQGLIPALRPKRLRKGVIRLHDDLIAGPVGEVRQFANLSLHASLVRHPYSGAEVDASTGRVTLPLPDRASAPIYHWDLLTWAHGRDARTFAEELWSSIETFVDGLLNAFERSIPRRLRKANR